MCQGYCQDGLYGDEAVGRRAWAMSLIIILGVIGYLIGICLYAGPYGVDANGNWKEKP